MAAAVDVLGLVGSTIEQVRFDDCVDSGGFGLVYRGRHLGLDEPVAIKCLRIATIQRIEDDMRESIAARFRDETKLLYRLSQGNLDIVRCIGGGMLRAPATNEPTPYMVLEWLEGQSLSTDLRERAARRMPRRTMEEAVTLLDSAAGALAYAHAQGVVHRDVKPGNIYLVEGREGVRAKVLDFGLAKIVDEAGLGVRPSVETGAGVHFCSPSYGAPEQFSPQVGPIGPWTDVYSLTLVLLEMMKGEKVRHAGSLAEGLLRAINPETGSPRASKLGLAVPGEVEALLHRAVAQSPSDRPADVGVFWSSLRALVRAPVAAGPRRSNPAAATVADANVAAAMERVRGMQGPVAASPFAGTMLMENAPRGAAHLVPVSPLAASAAVVTPAARPHGSQPPQGSSPPFGSQPPRALPPSSPPAPPRAPLGSAPLRSAPPPPESGGAGWFIAIFVLALVGLAGLATAAWFWLKHH